MEFSWILFNKHFLHIQSSKSILSCDSLVNFMHQQAVDCSQSNSILHFEQTTFTIIVLIQLVCKKFCSKPI